MGMAVGRGTASHLGHTGGEWSDSYKHARRRSRGLTLAQHALRGKVLQLELQLRSHGGSGRRYYRLTVLMMALNTDLKLFLRCELDGVYVVVKHS